MAKDVSTPITAYNAMASRWRLPHTLMGGTDAMRAATTYYLPKEPAETQQAYDNRLARSFLFNAFRKTVRSMAGRPFATPVALGTDMPKDLRDWSENIDLAGNDITIFAKDTFTNGLVDGLCHIMVEHPPMTAGMTLEAERAAGARPYFCMIPAGNLIGWRHDLIGGVSRLTQARIVEDHVVADGAYDVVHQKRVRVLYPGRWEVWRQNERNDWMIDSFGETSLPEIPLVTFYANRAGFMMAEPPLTDLADLNVQHWQSSSDQRHILHVARVPILFGAGLSTDETLVVGPNTMVKSSDSSAKLTYVEHEGKAIEAGKQDLDTIEDRMAVMGLELLVDRPGQQTATGKVIDTAAHASDLRVMTWNLKDALELAYAFAASYRKLSSGGSVELNQDFGISLRDKSELDIILKSRLAGEISRATFHNEMRRRGVLPDDFDSEEEAELLEAESMNMGRDLSEDAGSDAEEDTERGQDTMQAAA